uniref:Anti-proliferative protein domain-containing protein n=1 Tax=Romanomermis culicivorax TaxID=13658 RepID=A0A915IFQ6_ROMCU
MGIDSAVNLLTKYFLKWIRDELTVWVDPGEVTFRIGERGQATVIYNSADPNSVTLNRMLTQNLTSNADGTGLRVNFAPALWNNAQPLMSTPLNSQNQ